MAARTDTASGGQARPTSYSGPRHVADPSSCYFYHSIDLPGFGLQEGAWDLRGRFEDYTGHIDLAGKRVLDVGAASGFLSFEAERAGAAAVTSFDLDTARRQHLLPFCGSLYATDHGAWCREQTANFNAWKRSYWLTHRLTGSRARARYGDVYALPADIGRFDVVILGAILEHLRDPLAALHEAARITDDTIVVNTEFLDEPEPLAAFKGRVAEPHKSYVFWICSIAVFDEYMAIIGFEKVAEHKARFAATPPGPGEPRPMLERVALAYRRC